jgi:hypothetical protein
MNSMKQHIVGGCEVGGDVVGKWASASVRARVRQIKRGGERETRISNAVIRHAADSPAYYLSLYQLSLAQHTPAHLDIVPRHASVSDPKCALRVSGVPLYRLLAS